MDAIKPLPIFFISQALLEQRSGRFINQKNNLLSNALGKPDTRSVWYTRDHIAGLLDEIDHYGGDGLRIYFGMYEPDHPNFAGQLCLVMNPTRTVDGSTGHPDIIVENEPDFAERSALPRASGAGLEDNVFNKKKGGNLGSPCPPIC